MTVSSPAITGIDITVYLVEDVERAKSFYRDTLGLPMGTDYGPQGAEFELSDGMTFGIWKGDGPFRPSDGSVMFAVSDIKAAVEYYKARGVTIDDDGAVHEFPVCFMAMAKDSEGNGFILHQRKV